MKKQTSLTIAITAAWPAAGLLVSHDKRIEDCHRGSTPVPISQSRRWALAVATLMLRPPAAQCRSRLAGGSSCRAGWC
jgi:hypothetical protein